MKTSAPSLALLSLLLCGCATVKQARHAQTSSDRLPGEVTATAAELGLERGRAYALSDFERLALTHHPAILQAKQNLESARLACTLVRANRKPQLSASTSYGRSTQNSFGRRPNSAQTHGSWNGSLSLDLLLYDFGRLDAQERQALEDLLAAEEQLRAAELETLFNVRSAFCDFHRSDELYRVALESVKQYAEHLEEARTMVEVGTRRQYDVTKAEVDKSNAQLDVITYSNALLVTRAQLNTALGLAAAPEYLIGEGAMPPHAEPVDDLMAVARTNAPALAVLGARARAASAAVDQAVADLYPSLSLGADTSVSGRGFPLAWNFDWAARLAQSLFEGRRRMARIRDAVAQLRIARSREAEEEQALYLALTTAVTQRESARKRHEVSELIRRQAVENLEIVNEQYRVGLSSSIERTDAQVTLTQAKADVVRARYDGEAACARISQLTGQPAGPLTPEPPK